ncbi:MAG: creatininase family protein [Planctomycetota bacterium]
MTKVRYEEMLPHEAVEARTKCPVAFLPIGGIEWHGEHNCLGLDTVKIHAIAMRCAAQISGVAFPPLFYGEPRESYLMEANHDPDGKIREKMKLPEGSFAPGYMEEHRRNADLGYVNLLLHILHEFRSLGFKVIVVMAGHYPLLRHATAAAELFNLEVRNAATAWACTGYELVRDKIPHAGDHAAAWETSLMMVLRPELVDLSRLPTDPNEKLIGVGGRDPRQFASKEYGEEGLAAIIERVREKVQQLLKPYIK